MGIKLHWYRKDGAYVNREGFGVLLRWEGQIIWQAPQRQLVRIAAKNLADARRLITDLMKNMTISDRSQWRGYCRNCGSSLRSWDSAQALGEAIIGHVQHSPSRHPEFLEAA